jgi:electron transport complex protein RnfG
MKMIVPAIVLTLICAAAALALAGVHGGTAPIIAEQERLFTLRSVKNAIPPFDNEPDQDVVTIESGGAKVCVYRGRQGEEITGVALQQTNGEGYSGDVTVLVGLTPEGEVACGEDHLGLQILRHAETPGLGAVMEEAAWRRQFCDRTLEQETFWSVRKDGGEVDQLTGATITSRAVTAAVQSGLRFFEEHRETIMTGEPGTCGGE